MEVEPGGLCYFLTTLLCYLGTYLATTALVFGLAVDQSVFTVLKTENLSRTWASIGRVLGAVTGGVCLAVLIWNFVNLGITEVKGIPIKLICGILLLVPLLIQLIKSHKESAEKPVPDSKREKGTESRTTILVFGVTFLVNVVLSVDNAIGLIACISNNTMLIYGAAINFPILLCLDIYGPKIFKKRPVLVDLATAFLFGIAVNSIAGDKLLGFNYPIVLAIAAGLIVFAIEFRRTHRETVKAFVSTVVNVIELHTGKDIQKQKESKSSGITGIAAPTQLREAC